MSRAQLTDTLTALAMAVMPDHDHLIVEEAEISLPLIVRLERGPHGARICAQPPFSAFHSGFEPVVHRARLSLGSLSTTDLSARRNGTPIRSPWPARFPRGD
jgi:hypothetical protein